MSQFQLCRPLVIRKREKILGISHLCKAGQTTRGSLVFVLSNPHHHARYPYDTDVPSTGYNDQAGL